MELRGKLPGEGNQGLIFFYSASRRSNTWRRAVRKAYPGEKTKATARLPVWFGDFLGHLSRDRIIWGRLGRKRKV